MGIFGFANKIELFFVPDFKFVTEVRKFELHLFNVYGNSARDYF